MEITESMRFAARLSMHEFLLEQIIANAMLREADPIEAWRTISAALVAKTRTGTWPAQDSPDAAAVHQEMISQTQRFCAKVEARVLKP